MLHLVFFFVFFFRSFPWLLHNLSICRPAFQLLYSWHFYCRNAGVNRAVITKLNKFNCHCVCFSHTILGKDIQIKIVTPYIDEASFPYQTLRLKVFFICLNCCLFLKSFHLTITASKATVMRKVSYLFGSKQWCICIEKLNVISIKCLDNCAWMVWVSDSDVLVMSPFETRGDMRMRRILLHSNCMVLSKII